MKINPKLNRRIDKVIQKNERYANYIILLSIAIFFLGVGLIVFAVYKENVVLAIPSTIITAFLYWPIQQIDKIRKENTALAALPSLIATLPPAEAGQELMKLMSKLY